MEFANLLVVKVYKDIAARELAKSFIKSAARL